MISHSGYIILMVILLMSCKTKQFIKNDLPSSELIDSVITTAIQSDSVNIYKYSRESFDSLRNIRKVVILYDLNSELKDWSKIQDTFVQKKKAIMFSDIVNEFAFGYINYSLTHRAGILDTFNLSDSSFFDYQIKESKSHIIKLNLPGDISYITSNEIEKIKSLPQTNSFLRYNYIEISRPLFNTSKTKVVIGISYREICRMCDRKTEGGYYHILQKNANNWETLTIINWWNN